MSDSNKNRFKSQKEYDQDDLKQAQKIKPHLRRHVINQQVSKAEQDVKDHAAEVNKFFSDYRGDEIIKRASTIALRAFMVQRMWKHYPPPVPMAWVMTSYMTPELQQDKDQDIGSFGAFLANCYKEYSKTKGTYFKGRNPLADDQTAWFWILYCKNLVLIIKGDQRRIDAGNEGAIIVTDRK